MKIGIFKYLVVISLVFASGYLLMNVSNHVQIVESDIKDYDRAIALEEEELRVLKAEWAYLNDPSRLERLVSNEAGFTSPKAGNVISDIDDNAILGKNKNISDRVPIQSPLYREISSVNTNGGAHR